MHLLRKNELTLTEGKTFGKIFIFATPLILTNVLQILYNAADMIVVGRFSDVEGAVGAIGSTGAMINLVINLLFGIAVGANVVVANAIGANDEEQTRRSVHSSLIVGLMAGIISMVIGLCFSRQLLLWMDADPELLEMSVLYTKIYFLGMPFSAVLNYAVAILRAKGDTQTPLYIMSVSGILNVILNVFFVAICGMNVDGVAIATVISTVVSATAVLFAMSRDRGWCRLEPRRLLHLDKGIVHRIILIGLPAGLQGMLFSLSNVFIQRAINGFGTAVITGNSISTNIEGISYTATNSIYQASITFTGQNMGAKKYKRLGMIFRDCYCATAIIAAVCTVLLYVFRVQLTQLYISPDAENFASVLATTDLRFKIVITTYLFLAFMEVGSGLVRGMGKSALSMMVSLVGSCVFRIVWIYTVFAASQQLWVLYLSLPISWAMTASVHFVCAMVLRKKALAKENA